MNQKPVRVLHIVGAMNQGGIENFLMNMYRKINREKVQFDFCIIRNVEGVFENEILNLGGRIYHLNVKNKYDYLAMKRAYIKILNENEYRIVHCHYAVLSYLFLKEAKKADIPVRISHMHIASGNKFEIKKLSLYVCTMIFRCTYKKYVTDMFACSYKAAEMLYGKREAPNATIVKNGIDMNKFLEDAATRENVRRKLKIGKDEILVGHVGRFSFPKNHTFLIKVFYEYHKLYSKSKLVLFGEGELKSKIKEDVVKLGIEDAVIFHDVVKNIYDYYQAMDIFLFPSRYEGLGMVLIEAQLAGLPCLAADAIPHEVNFSSNFKYLSLKDSPEIWARCMQELLNTKQDSQVAENIRKAGYDSSDVVNKLEDFYLNCMK